MNATHALETGGGVHLATERWVPPREVRAHVVFVHGLGEHRRALPYVPFYEKLATSGYAVLAFDLRGHGASDGPRLYARDFAVLEQDVARAVGVAADDAQGRPVFVIGGSLGGLLAIASALNTTVQLLAREDMRGKVIAIYLGCLTGALPVGLVLWGWAADAWGIRPVTVVAGLLLVVVTGWFAAAGRFDAMAAAD